MCACAGRIREGGEGVGVGIVTVYQTRLFLQTGLRGIFLEGGLAGEGTMLKHIKLLG